VSLRTRLLIALGVVAIVALAVADVVTYSSLRSFLLTRIDQGMEAAHVPAEQYARAQLTGSSQANGNQNFGGGPPGAGPNQSQIADAAPGTAIELRYANGQTEEYSSLHLPGDYSDSYLPRLPSRITGFSQQGSDTTVYFDAPSSQGGGPEFRVRAQLLDSSGDILIMASPLTGTYQTLHRLLLVGLAVTGGAILIAIGAGWWLVRLGLRPLRDMERTAGAIAQGELGHRVPGDNRNTEVGHLARALNVMLGRIQDAFAARDRTEHALRDSQTRLRQFVADASHELRTPVAAVSAYAELFERGADSRPDDLVRVMRGIRGETSRMGHLVDDLLLLARMDERLPIEHIPVDLVALAGEAVEAARTVGPDWTVTLRAERPVEVVGDRARLRQVFDNLLGNVRAHTPPGTTARVTVTTEADQAVVTIRDDGPGISAEEAGRLFERFYRVDASRSRASGGAGLGLSIVAAIVEAHRGTVEAAPAPDGTGAVFTFRIPTDHAAYS
jgi:two-component system OmpR family sensor kinase